MIDKHRLAKIYEEAVKPENSILYWRDRAEKAEKELQEIKLRNSPRRSRRKRLYQLLTGQPHG